MVDTVHGGWSRRATINDDQWGLYNNYCVTWYLIMLEKWLELLIIVDTASPILVGHALSFVNDGKLRKETVDFGCTVHYG